MKFAFAVTVGLAPCLAAGFAFVGIQSEYGLAVAVIVGMPLALACGFAGAQAIFQMLDESR